MTSIKEAGYDMKSVAAIIIIFIVAYSIYYDLTIGTLPHGAAASSQVEEAQMNLSEPSDPYTLIEVNPGDTVISILEKLQQGHVPVSIDQLVKDFEELNNGTKPEQIHIGKSYKFPIYQ